MRIVDFILTAVVVAGVSSTALAQNSSSEQSAAADATATSRTTLTQIPPSAQLVAYSASKTSGTAAAQVPASTPVSPTSSGPADDHWFASAYLGSNFGGRGGTELRNDLGNETESNGGSTTSVNWGGDIGYVWSGIGAEFMANRAPNFDLRNTLLERQPTVSTYMANAIYAIPVSAHHLFRPFVSGGAGSVHIRSSIFKVDPSATPVADLNALETEDVSGSRFGWNIGAGLMAFNGPWGLRADLRRYKATNSTKLDDTLAGEFLNDAVSGISFWNFYFGVGFRW